MMKIRWVRLLLVLGLILTLTACIPPKDTAPKADAPAEQSEGSIKQDSTADTSKDAEDTTSDDAVSDEAEAEDTTEEESAPEPPVIDAAQVFTTNCAGCHGDKRQGGGGPPLLPERLTKETSEYAKTISEGVSGTRMPSWKDKLSVEEITALSEWILTPVE